MTSEMIYKELGGIDPALIAQAAPGEKVAKKQRKWIKWVAVAACLTLMAVGKNCPVLRLPRRPL